MKMLRYIIIHVINKLNKVRYSLITALKFNAVIIDDLL